MGMYTYVYPAKEILPPEYQGKKIVWQTKDVVECRMENLEITAGGDLVYVWWEREWREDTTTILGGYFHRTVEHRDRLDFHGDMRFYTWDNKTWIELIARFTNGKLEYVKPAEVSAA